MANKTYNTDSYKKSFGIALGVLAAIVILASQSFYFDYVASFKSAVKIEQATDAEDTRETVLDMGQQVVSSAIQFCMQHALHFIAQIYENVEISAPSIQTNFKGLTAYFQTLFRLIISPNAP